MDSREKIRGGRLAKMTNPMPGTPSGDPPIYSKILEVIRLLRESQQRIVLAESCTGGLAAAWFTSVPGVSELFCGSMVVYRNETKSQWLGVDPQLLANPQIGPVSPQASQELARRVLEATPEADVALAITGHFGPGAPAHLDRRVFMAWVQRMGPDSFGAVVGRESLLGGLQVPETGTAGLDTAGRDSEGLAERLAWENRRRLQALAVVALLDFAVEMLRKCKFVKKHRGT
jgi:PncC family amidohydrolase